MKLVRKNLRETTIGVSFAAHRDQDQPEWMNKLMGIQKANAGENELERQKKYQKEEAPTNNVGSGNLTGMGVRGAANQEPGVSKKKRTKSPILFPKMMRRTNPNNISEDLDTFMGACVFEVDSHTFHNIKWNKRKYKHWRKYLGEDDALAEIREYANKYTDRPIIVRNRVTSEMVYVRYGKTK